MARTFNGIYSVVDGVPLIRLTAFGTFPQGKACGGHIGLPLRYLKRLPHIP